jgi:hypothetical protein
MVDPDAPLPPPRPPSSYTVTLRLAEARDLPPVSDHHHQSHSTNPQGYAGLYATIELVDLLHAKPLAKARKHTSKTCHKTMRPFWNAECVWPGLDVEQPESLAMKVAVYSTSGLTGGYSSEVVGGFMVPLAKGLSKDHQAPKWYPLAAVGPSGKPVKAVRCTCTTVASDNTMAY